VVIKQKHQILKNKENKKRDKFISNGGHVLSDKKGKIEFTNVLVRIPNFLLKELDDLVQQKPWLTRTQWIVEALHEKIKSDYCNDEEKQENTR